MTRKIAVTLRFTRMLLAVFVVTVAILCGIRTLLWNNPFHGDWIWFALLIVAADQIRTEVGCTEERSGQVVSLSSVAVLWTVMFEPERLHAFTATAVGYFLSTVVFERKRFNWKKRLVNCAALVLSSGVLATTYYTLTETWETVWPSAAAAAAVLAGAVAYDITNIALLAPFLHYLGGESWRSVYRIWADYWYLPVITATAAAVTALAATAVPQTLAIVAVAAVVFLKPSYCKKTKSTCL